MSDLFNPVNYTPAKLQALLIGLLAMAVVCLGLTTWALIERSQKLECAVERVQLTDQNAILAADLAKQNKSIDDLANTGRQQRAVGATALAKAVDEGKGRAAEIEGLRALLASKDPAAIPIPPRPPGSAEIVAGSCGHSLALVRGDLLKAVTR